MHITHNLRVETTQKLTITPQLCQTMSILQMSAQELVAAVENELLENPVLEIGEQHSEQGEDEPDARHFSETAVFDDVDNLGKINLNYDDWAEYFASGSGLSQMRDLSFDKSQNPVDLFAARPYSLHEHLEMQLNFTMPDNDARMVGKFLIGSIDDNGYLTTTTAEAAAVLKKPESLVADVLAHIQTFDPAGVGARNLRECLEIQLAQSRCCPSWELYYLVKAIIEKYLEQVGASKLKYVAGKLAASVQDVQQAVDIIRKFEPKPGRVFGSSKTLYIQPDVIIEKGHDGNYIISINEKNVPTLAINSYYRQIIRNMPAGDEARKFVGERLNSAVWLIKSIEQRRQTLTLVTEAIVTLQRDFFDFGSKFLRPLVMKQVADAIGVHESTVSRTVANKYAATPYGLLPLGYFFSSGISGINGEVVAASRIKRDILELVSAENPKEPLSDNDLADKLSQAGVPISRRTVTKYRKELAIPASYKRKRY